MKKIPIKIDRPIVFFDLETTGLDINEDRIVEISLLKVLQNFETLQKTWRVNPGIPIPEEVIEIHGIKNEDVKDKPSFGEVADKVVQFIGNSDLAGYNITRFDLPFLAEELLRAGLDVDLKKLKTLDMMKVYHLMEPRNLSAAYRYYCDKEMNNVHSAEADTLATYEVFLGQLEKYQNHKVSLKEYKKELPFNDINTFMKITGNNNFIDFSGRLVYRDQKAIFNFGKYKGKEVEQIFEKDPHYIKWILEKKFSLHTKKMIKEIHDDWTEKRSKII